MKKATGVWWSRWSSDWSPARRARKKNSDRWNNVCAQKPENVGFWRGHCSATVPPDTRGAARQSSHRGRPPRRVNSGSQRLSLVTARQAHRDDTAGMILTEAAYLGAGWRTKARKARKAPKIAAKTTTAATAVGGIGVVLAFSQQFHANRFLGRNSEVLSRPISARGVISRSGRLRAVTKSR